MKRLEFTSGEIDAVYLNPDGTVNFALNDQTIERWSFWRGKWMEVEGDDQEENKN